MYDIIFDFSASPIGGGLVRLRAYIDFFERREINVLFLVHPSAFDNKETIEKIKSNIKILPRNPLGRLFFDHTYIEPFVATTKVFFSYGIPVYKKVGEINWMHLSNALPFVYKECTVDYRDKIRCSILASRFRQVYRQLDFISAESNATIKLFDSFLKTHSEKIVLQNGLNISEENSGVNRLREPTALTVGVESYKRLDNVYKVYQESKDKFGLKKLIIIGKRSKIPHYLKNNTEIELIEYLPHEQLLSLYRQCEYYISMSEIENSSNAVLEAVLNGCKCILSDIPAHREMFSEVSSLQSPTQNIFLVESKRLVKSQNNDWESIINFMCNKMRVNLITL